MIQCFETKLSDLNAVAGCHMLSFPGSLSTKLGRSYCMKMLSWYVVSDRGMLFHLSEGDKLIGYCGGIMSRIPGQHGSATSMTQHTFGSLVLNLMIRPWLIFHHEIRGNIPLILKNIRLRFLGVASGKNMSPPASDKEFIPSMGLVVIGVSPEHQGKGYGSLLLREFEARARKEGFKKISLSVRKENLQAITSYKRNGWVIGREGQEELYMYKNLD